MHQYLEIHPEVQNALADGKPVVALESTIISHGMPYPQNINTAIEVEILLEAMEPCLQRSPSSMVNATPG